MILARVFEGGRGGMSRELARQVLKLSFGEEGRSRMHELAQKNQDGRLTPEELEELDHYVTAADLLSILHSLARRKLGPEVGDGELPCRTNRGRT